MKLDKLGTAVQAGKPMTANEIDGLPLGRSFFGFDSLTDYPNPIMV